MFTVYCVKSKRQMKLTFVSAFKSWQLSPGINAKNSHSTKSPAEGR